MPHRIYIFSILHVILFRWVRWVLALAFVGALVAEWMGGVAMLAAYTCSCATIALVSVACAVALYCALYLYGHGGIEGAV